MAGLGRGFPLCEGLQRLWDLFLSSPAPPRPHPEQIMALLKNPEVPCRPCIVNASKSYGLNIVFQVKVLNLLL